MPQVATDAAAAVTTDAAAAAAAADAAKPSAYRKSAGSRASFGISADHVQRINDGTVRSTEEDEVSSRRYGSSIRTLSTETGVTDDALGVAPEAKADGPGHVRSPTTYSETDSSVMSFAEALRAGPGGGFLLAEEQRLRGSSSGARLPRRSFLERISGGSGSGEPGSQLAWFMDYRTTIRHLVYPQRGAGAHDFLWRQGASSDRCGFMQKKSKWSSRFRDRWFVLQGHRLFYAQSPNSHPHGMADLTTCTEVSYIDDEETNVWQLRLQLREEAPGDGAQSEDEVKDAALNIVGIVERELVVRCADRDTLMAWHEALLEVLFAIKTKGGLDGAIQSPHEGPAFLGGEPVLREGYLRKLSSTGVWGLRYVFATPERLAYGTDFGARELRGEISLHECGRVRVIAADTESQKLQTGEQSASRMVSVEISVPPGGAEQHATVQGVVRTSEGPQLMAVRVPEGAVPGTTMTVHVPAQMSAAENDLRALGNARQVIIATGVDSYFVLEAATRQEAIAWAWTLRGALQVIEESKTMHRLRRTQQYNAARNSMNGSDRLSFGLTRGSSGLNREARRISRANSLNQARPSDAAALRRTQSDTDEPPPPPPAGSRRPMPPATPPPSRHSLKDYAHHPSQGTESSGGGAGSVLGIVREALTEENLAAAARPLAPLSESFEGGEG